MRNDPNSQKWRLIVALLEALINLLTEILHHWP